MVVLLLSLADLISAHTSFGPVRDADYKVGALRVSGCNPQAIACLKMIKSYLRLLGRRVVVGVIRDGLLLYSSESQWADHRASSGLASYA